MARSRVLIEISNDLEIVEATNSQELALKRLCAAMLLRALKDLESNRTEYRRSAETWLLFSDRALISVHDICIFLSIDYKRIRSYAKSILYR